MEYKLISVEIGNNFDNCEQSNGCERGSIIIGLKPNLFALKKNVLE